MEVLKSITSQTPFESVKEILEKKGLVVIDYPNEDLYLVKYDKQYSDMMDPEVRLCRGLIVDKDANHLVCFPPEKSVSLSYFSDNAKDIIYEEFVDGTMINIFFHNNEWHISTRSRLGAACRFYSDKTFRVLFAESSVELDYSKLNKDCCYTMVLQHPENRIVTQYQEPSYVLVFARDLSDGVMDLDIYQVQKELQDNGLNIKVPKRYSFASIKEARKFVEGCSYDVQGVILKSNCMRSKIRNVSYNYVKQLRGNTRNMKYIYYNLRKKGDVKEFLSYFPEHNDTFIEFQNELHSVSRNLWELYKKCYINKTHDKLQTIPYEYRPICYELHGIYLNTRQKISWDLVKSFVNNLPIPRQLFIVNYNKRNEHSETNQTN